MTIELKPKLTIAKRLPRQEKTQDSPALPIKIETIEKSLEISSETSTSPLNLNQQTIKNKSWYQERKNKLKNLAPKLQSQNLRTEILDIKFLNGCQCQFCGPSLKIKIKSEILIFFAGDQNEYWMLSSKNRKFKLLESEIIPWIEEKLRKVS